MSKKRYYCPIIELKPDHDDEVFKLITENEMPGIKPYYAISNYGKLYTNAQKNSTGSNIRACQPGQDGYVRADLQMKDGSTKNIGLHRLILNVFDPIGEKANEMVPNHLDRDRSHNYYNMENPDEGNLKWATIQENIQHAAQSNNYAINDEMVLSIYLDAYNGNTDDQNIANKYGVSVGSVKAIRLLESARYKRIMEEHGFTDPVRYHHGLVRRLDNSDIRMIYNLIKKGVRDIDLAEKYNVSIETVRSIRMCIGRYKDIIAQEQEPIPIRINRPQISDDLVIKIHAAHKEGKTLEEIADEFDITTSMADDIRYGHGRFKEVLSKNNLEPIRHDPKERHTLNKYSDQEAIKIYGELMNGAKPEDIAKREKADRNVIYNIRNCTNNYSFLKEKYNLVPLDRYYGYGKKRVDVLKPEDIKYIYEKAVFDGYSYSKIAQKYGISDSTIGNIIHGSSPGYLKVLQENGYEPVIDSKKPGRKSDHSKESINSESKDNTRRLITPIKNQPR